MALWAQKVSRASKKQVPGPYTSQATCIFYKNSTISGNKMDVKSDEQHVPFGCI